MKVLDQDFNGFREYLEKINILDGSNLEIVAKYSSLISVKKYHIFVDAGEHSDDMAFVTKGLFQKYYLVEDGSKFIKEFVVKSNLIGAYASFLTGNPSAFTIQALEDSQIIKFNLKKITEEIGHLPTYEKFRRKISEMIFFET